MICTDPSLKGIVPGEGGEFAGQTYHCSTDQHKNYIDANGGAAEGASSLAVTAVAAVVSAYMLA